MKNEEVLFEKQPDKKIAVITFNRPEKLNAFTFAHWERINELVMAVDDDEDQGFCLSKI